MKKLLESLDAILKKDVIFENATTVEQTLQSLGYEKENDSTFVHTVRRMSPKMAIALHDKLTELGYKYNHGRGIWFNNDHFVDTAMIHNRHAVKFFRKT